MPLPKLSLLQSRLAASLIASLMLLMLYLAFSSHNFAYAANVDSIRPEDHNHERLLGLDLRRADIEDLEIRDDGLYRAGFLGYDEGITGRAPVSDSPTQLENNIPRADNLAQGQTNFYMFPSTALGRRVRNSEDEGLDDVLKDNEEADPVDFEPRLQQRASSRNVYISVNVCSQPKPAQSTTTAPPPQLRLFISQSDSNTQPGPGSTGDQTTLDLVQGAMMKAISASGNTYLGLYGVNNTAYEDMWSTEIAVSTDDYYHTYMSSQGPNLNLVDSDSNAALLITGSVPNPSGMTDEELVNSAPPYVVFASNNNNSSIQGLQNSYCGLQQNADIKPLDTGKSPGNVQASLTTRTNDEVRQQFYISDISNGTTYNVILAAYGGGNSTSTTRRAGVVRGGGTVWPMTTFKTLSDGNCAVIYDLEFCDQTAYAVPANTKNFPTMDGLAAFYDNNTVNAFRYFQNALAQIPCNTTSSAQYSLARDCDDCVSAYKTWLCAVSIPRCTDFSSDLEWLQPRSMVNPFPNGTKLPDDTVDFASKSLALSSSRNPQIDSVVQPGPYKEILPCDDLCYNIVQSCPSAMGFACPLPGRTGFNASYGTRFPTADLSCNFPGAEFLPITSGGSLTALPPLWAVFTMVVMAWVFA